MRFIPAVLLAVASTAVGLTPEYVEANAPLMWAAFKRDHQKQYTGSDEGVRFAIFKQNMVRAAQMSQNEPLAQFGATKFADLTEAEFGAYRGMGSPNKTGLKVLDTSALPAADLGQSVDWRTGKVAVTHVKNQGSCGSCWSFSASGNIEGQYVLRGQGALTAFSEQQMVACDKTFGDNGCKGGLPTNAYKYVHSVGGLETEADYPYTSGWGIRGECLFDASKAVAKVSGGGVIASDEATMLAWMTKNGPLSIGVNAAGLVWQLYFGGIVKDCRVEQPDHGVLIVGYGTEGSVNYWIVKNSWGATWGEHGYIRLEYGTNQCNIVSMPSSATM